MKSIIKESIIIVLLIIVIFLLMAVIFYEYMPISIAVPDNVMPYVTPSEIKDEINEEITEHSKQTVSYEITESNLKDYTQSKSYDAAKESPFLPYYEGYIKLDSDSANKGVDNDSLQQSGGQEEASYTTTDEQSTKSANSHDTKLK